MDVAKLPLFVGSKDLDNINYRLWLYERYKIDQDFLTENILVGLRSFDNLDSALAFAMELDR